ncbi:MAG: hypothetical protein BGO35_06220 [Burkholderiales bacterium 64-34]|nr:MAG: hypothetical protein BGO35_06220 [Burkholderiales bacterium 64-34]
MQPQVQFFQEDFYQQLRDSGVDVRFVLYDLLPITMPQYFPEGARDNHERWVEVAAKTDGLICISETVAQEFEQWRQHHLPTAMPRVDWFHMGADIVGASPSRGVPVETGAILNQLLECPTFIMVGTLEPRKGHAQVLDAADALWNSKRKFNLVLVGKQGWRVDALAKRLRKHPLIGKKLFWLEGISDEYLEKVYEFADCLIAASFGEGFGLPLIEAAQHKIPIIARDIPIFREVAGDCATYFTADGPNELKKTIENWLDGYIAGSVRDSSAIPWLSWNQSANRLLQIIEKNV